MWYMHLTDLKLYSWEHYMANQKQKGRYYEKKKKKKIVTESRSDVLDRSDRKLVSTQWKIKWMKATEKTEKGRKVGAQILLVCLHHSQKKKKKRLEGIHSWSPKRSFFQIITPSHTPHSFIWLRHFILAISQGTPPLLFKILFPVRVTGQNRTRDC